ncbi:hypothetical protein [Criblamydia sequanensis]|uniref:Membrane protein n=1 Tax=Candidatus Criblamydia sequanensis CRIB-18 TaxID=1437425 RepID=A0A090CXV4_9BACT|nr:hypothetical protein [Criblamydia sequanensis]CDR32886.1 putative membrane protein [Criblamydia sequanensis CRIB-18]
MELLENHRISFPFIYASSLRNREKLFFFFLAAFLIHALFFLSLRVPEKNAKLYEALKKTTKLQILLKESFLQNKSKKPIDELIFLREMPLDSFLFPQFDFHILPKIQITPLDPADLLSKNSRFLLHNNKRTYLKNDFHISGSLAAFSLIESVPVEYLEASLEDVILQKEYVFHVDVSSDTGKIFSYDIENLNPEDDIQPLILFLRSLKFETEKNEPFIQGVIEIIQRSLK